MHSRAGAAIFPSRLAAMLAGGAIADAEDAGPPADKGVSRRQTEILCLLVLGRGNKAIARGPGITVAAVMVHLNDPFDKF